MLSSALIDSLSARRGLRQRPTCLHGARPQMLDPNRPPRFDELSHQAESSSDLLAGIVNQTRDSALQGSALLNLLLPPPLLPPPAVQQAVPPSLYTTSGPLPYMPHQIYSPPLLQENKLSRPATQTFNMPANLHFRPLQSPMRDSSRGNSSTRDIRRQSRRARRQLRWRMYGDGDGHCMSHTLRTLVSRCLTTLRRWRITNPVTALLSCRQRW